MTTNQLSGRIDLDTQNNTNETLRNEYFKDVSCRYSWPVPRGVYIIL